MEELEQIVLRKIKELIKKELPRPGFVDGPWKIYTKRVTDQAIKFVSQEAIANVRKEIYKSTKGNILLSEVQIHKLISESKKWSPLKANTKAKEQ